MCVLFSTSIHPDPAQTLSHTSRRFHFQFTCIAFVSSCLVLGQVTTFPALGNVIIIRNCNNLSCPAKRHYHQELPPLLSKFSPLNHLASTSTPSTSSVVGVFALGFGTLAHRFPATASPAQVFVSLRCTQTRVYRRQPVRDRGGPSRLPGPQKV